jgi:hypothetical protein
MTDIGSEAATTADSTEEEDAPCCWICLSSEGPDDVVLSSSTNKPSLARDCSCRGSSGYAHLSCIVGWAENECRRAGRDSNDSFSVCPNCKQLYQNMLRNDLSKARVTFVEREYTMDNAIGVSMISSAIMPRMMLIDAEKEQDRIEGVEICSKLMQLIEYTKSDNSRSWAQLVGSGYMTIATFHLRMGMRFGFSEWKDCLLKAKEYYEMAVEIYKKEGDDLSVSSTEKMISRIASRLGGNVEERNKAEKESDLSIERKKYKFYLENLGRNHTTTINAGVSFAQALFDSFYTIEAERLVTRLHGISQRVHGGDHNSTVDALTCLQRLRERRVCVMSRPDDDDTPFQALRYADDDHQKLVIQGPISIPRNIDKEQIFEEDYGNVSYVNGTPVVFHSLVKSQQLNGKIGDVRGFDGEETGRYTIKYVEGDLLHTVRVMPCNLRIVFDLPDIVVAEQQN